MTSPILKSILILLSVTALAGCGRTPLSALQAPPVDATRPAPALDVPSAVKVARTALASATADVRYVAAFGITNQGRVANSVRTGWVVGFVDGQKATLVGVDWMGGTRVVNAKLPANTVTIPLKVDSLPSLNTTLAWAREAGLQKSSTYQVAWLADGKGPFVGVAQMLPPGSDPLVDNTPERAVVLLDALTGKALKPIEKSKAPEVSADSPEGAADVAMKALSLGHGR